MSSLSRTGALFVLCTQVALTSCAYLDLAGEVPFPKARELRIAERRSEFMLSCGNELMLLEMGDLRRPKPEVVKRVAYSATAFRNIVVNEDEVVVSNEQTVLLMRAEKDDVTVVGGSSITDSKVTIAVSVGDKIFVFVNSKGDTRARVDIFQKSEDGDLKTLKASIKLIGEVIDVVTNEAMVYAISSVGYIMVFDSTKTDGYTLRSITPTLQKPTCLTMFRDFIYVGVGNELRAYFVHPTGNLEEASRFTVNAQVRDVAFTRGNIYAATSEGLTIIDVKDPRRPYESGFRRISSPAKSIEVHIDIAYIVTENEHLVMIDVVPPVNEVLLVATPTPTAAPKKAAVWIPTNEDVYETTVSGSAPFTMVDVDNGIGAWSDLFGSQFFDFPEWLMGSKAFVAPSSIAKDTKLHIACADIVCNVFIFFEHCLPCSASSNGGLPSILVSDGWVPSSCGPKFRLRKNSAPHSTIIFRKQIRKGTTTVLPGLSKDARFVGFAVKEGRTMCEAISSEAECNTGTFLCKWDEVVGGCMPKVTSCKISKKAGITLAPTPRPSKVPDEPVKPVEVRVREVKVLEVVPPRQAPPPRQPAPPPSGATCTCAAFE
eukprot:TRINITY_DN4817_c0_g2_i1.p1 TRINITY_DN4817_c0_g2~~TRINITY_DN4817_c0_g2_i1.p1  ORF type:complete len:600 (+),score=125.93 TRINITY_DN4817_c0_g2_i1:35-1834(+)